jgi:hypothetical protein
MIHCADTVSGGEFTILVWDILDLVVSGAGVSGKPNYTGDDCNEADNSVRSADWCVFFTHN